MAFKLAFLLAVVAFASVSATTTTTVTTSVTTVSADDDSEGRLSLSSHDRSVIRKTRQRGTAMFLLRFFSASSRPIPNTRRCSPSSPTSPKTNC
ncbi:hypothetical protein DAPPUDRAFT_252901 [Daphnia pulex]|uniref:Uncharacterized protein n=1 Tax=Daphnia pulex TaxID=6669 RepID=E9H3R2_DAPPU|nr:hypothetical protein DAPPUDRAFT_252901 [Daphnia pulex]|eukprot:EFX73659.1 hypothetical protein DAPPUDRAFT_252901 [Daphnia pulex]